MENMWDAMRARHSVRHYINRPIEEEKVRSLREEIGEINRESGLFFDLLTENTEIFKGSEPRYGSFSGCRNLFALWGPKGADEKVGWYGERLVLLAQSLGLSTCWVALTFEKGKMPPSPPGMVLHDVIALGYGENSGVPHRDKPLDKLCRITPDTPEWFKKGMEAALLAPTAINQQRFRFEQTGPRTVRARALLGPCSKTDLGIVKYHFTLGAGEENFTFE